MRNLVIGTIALGLASSAVVQAQQAAPAAPQARPAPPPAAPAPRWPDGRISFSGSPTNVGNWEGPANASIFFNMVNGKLVKPQPSLPTNKTVDEIPFKPGMRALYDSRADQDFSISSGASGTGILFLVVIFSLSFSKSRSE